MFELPLCPKCGKYPLLPISDYGPANMPNPAAVIFKAWACADDDCKYIVYGHSGEVKYSRSGR